MKYKVRVTETVYNDFEVEAENESDAVCIAQEQYDDCKIILEPGNLIDVNFKVINKE